MSQLFASGSQSIGVSASISVLPMNIQDLSPLGWTGWIPLLSKGLSRVFSNTSLKVSILQHSAIFVVQLSYPYMTTGKTIALTRWTFVGKVMSPLFNMLFRLSDFTFTFHFHALEKEMATHSSILAWGILMHRGACACSWAAINGVIKSWTWVSDSL